MFGFFACEIARSDHIEDETLADGDLACGGTCRQRSRRIPGTPDVDKLNLEINRALNVPSLREKMSALGYELVGGTSEQFAEHDKKEFAKWADVVKRAGITVD